ncbi:MAG: septum formation initiator family protein [Bacteroidaceae bacterium]|jgi:cell division protein FtsB|nr:septum formation initiator family protein [Bacteroidaceae bacterium]MBR4779379.1 septum formation initiator family protein [Bacteroidaceae bacterium]
MKKFLSQLWHYIGRHKYLITVIAFLLIVGFLDKNNMMVRLKNRYEISRLSAQKQEFQNLCDSLSDELQSFDTDGKSLERIAREQYGMHEAGEDVFIVKDK